MHIKIEKFVLNATPDKGHRMKQTLTTSFCYAVLLALFLILIESVFAYAANGDGVNKRVTVTTDDSRDRDTNDKYVTIDFNDVDITVLIKFISELTGKNFIVDNRVKGKVTIISPGKISVKEAYTVFESVLEVHGFATVPAGQVTKIVPSPDARSKNIETRIKSGALSGEGPEDKIVTQLIPLRFASSSEIKRLFTPLVSKNSVILAYEPTNTLIVTDAHSNIKRLMRILNAIDVMGVGNEISVIPLEYADATRMVKTLSVVFRPAAKAAKNGGAAAVLQFVADERTNTLIFMASEDDTIRIKKLISLLDREAPRGKGKIRVYYLEHANAEDMAEVLKNLPTKHGAKDKASQGPFVSEDISVTADKATNSLVIMAEGEDYMVIEELIKKLDIPRAMVYIESLIMEVNVNKDFNLGIDWAAYGSTDLLGTETADGQKGKFGVGFSGDGLGVTSSKLLAPNGLAMGIVSGEIELEIGGQTITLPNIGAIVTAFKSDEDIHILSTPQILTTDNEEASIIVAKNIPFQTKVSTSGDSDEVYNSYEYRDVGLTLKITPHITKDRMVRLQLTQELSSVSGTLTTLPTTSKRSVDTTVIVKDRNTVVLGGLIDDNITNSVTKVPLLGDIPLLGRLFRSNSTSNEKTNLYIFITPRVIQNPSEAKNLLNEKREQIGPLEGGHIKMYHAPDIELDSGKTKEPSTVSSETSF